MNSFEPTPAATLPGLHQPWLEALLDAAVPAETVANCEDWFMCAESAARSDRVFRFIPEVKCCGYVPILPNFLVGGVLLDDDSAMEPGRRGIRTRIAERAAVTPLGLMRSPTQEVLYDHVTKHAGFGRNAMVRCPHYVESYAGNCSIWRHRNGVCSTWFCKHVRGARGSTFWNSLQGLLTIVEQQLARWCLLRLDALELRKLFVVHAGDTTKISLDSHADR